GRSSASGRAARAGRFDRARRGQGELLVELRGGDCGRRGRVEQGLAPFMPIVRAAGIGRERKLGRGEIDEVYGCHLTVHFVRGSGFVRLVLFVLLVLVILVLVILV